MKYGSQDKTGHRNGHFFAQIMLKFNKNFNLKIISIILSMVFLCNSSSIAKDTLRVESSFQNQENKKRMYEVYTVLWSKLRQVKERIKLWSRAEEFLQHTMPLAISVGLIASAATIHTYLQGDQVARQGEIPKITYNTPFENIPCYPDKTRVALLALSMPSGQFYDKDNIIAICREVLDIAIRRKILEFSEILSLIPYAEKKRGIQGISEDSRQVDLVKNIIMTLYCEAYGELHFPSIPNFRRPLDYDFLLETILQLSMINDISYIKVKDKEGVIIYTRYRPKRRADTGVNYWDGHIVVRDADCGSITRQIAESITKGYFSTMPEWRQDLANSTVSGLKKDIGTNRLKREILREIFYYLRASHGRHEAIHFFVESIRHSLDPSLRGEVLPILYEIIEGELPHYNIVVLYSTISLGYKKDSDDAKDWIFVLNALAKAGKLSGRFDTENRAYAYMALMELSKSELKRVALEVFNNLCGNFHKIRDEINIIWPSIDEKMIAQILHNYDTTEHDILADRILALTEKMNEADKRIFKQKMHNSYDIADYSMLVDRIITLAEEMNKATEVMKSRRRYQKEIAKLRRQLIELDNTRLETLRVKLDMLKTVPSRSIGGSPSKCLKTLYSEFKDASVRFKDLVKKRIKPEGGKYSRTAVYVELKELIKLKLVRRVRHGYYELSDFANNLTPKQLEFVCNIEELKHYKIKKGRLASTRRKIYDNIQDLSKLKNKVTFFLEEELKTNPSAFTLALDKLENNNNIPIVLVKDREERKELSKLISIERFRVMTFEEIGIGLDLIDLYTMQVLGIDGIHCMPTKLEPGEKIVVMEGFIGSRNKIELEGKELIRQIHTDSSFKTYIVTDQLYSLVAPEDDEGNDGITVPSGGYPATVSAEALRIWLLLKVASSLGLPGASILQQLYTKGDVIFLKASSFIIEPDVKLEPNSNRWTEEKTALWHERIHLGIERLNPTLLKQICNIIAKADSETVVNLRQKMAEKYRSEIGSKRNSEEVIAYITTEVLDLQQAKLFINNTFPFELAKVVMNIWTESCPSEVEIKEMNNIAREILPCINELSYASVAADVMKGSDVGVTEVIRQFLATKELLRSL